MTQQNPRRQKQADSVEVDAALLKEMRQLCGLTLARLAYKTDVSAIWLNELELGRVTTLKAERLSKVMRVLRRELILRSKRMAVVLDEPAVQQVAAR